MKSGPRLFELIKSLSKEEKRLLKLRAGYGPQAEGQHYYILLFDLLEAQSQFEEKSFKRKYAHLTWMRYYAQVKVYLYEAILDTVVALQQEKDAVMLTTSYLQRVHVLRERGLHRQAMLFLDKAHDLAQEADLQQFMPQIHYLKMVMHTYYFPTAADIQTQEQLLMARSQEATEALHCGLAYMEEYFLYYRLFTYIDMRHVERTELHRAELEEKLRQFEQEQTRMEACPSVSLRLLRWKNESIIKNLLHDGAQGRYSLQSLRLLEQQPKFILHRPHFYVTALYNACSEALAFGDVDTARDCVARFEQAGQLYGKKAHFNMLEHRLRSIIMQITLHIGEETYTQGLAFYESQIAWLASNKKEALQRLRLTLQFVVGTLYFWLGKESAALKSWSPFFRSTPVPSVVQMQQHARLLRLLFLWQRGDWAGLEIEARGTRFFLKKIGEWDTFSQILFRFVRRCCQLPSRMRRALACFQRELEALPKGNPAFYLFNYLHWTRLQRERLRSYE